MKVDGRFDYPGATLAQVFDMVTDPEFQRRKCAATGALSYEVTKSGPDDAPTLVSARRMPTDRLPDFARRIVGTGIDVTETVVWSAEAGGVRSAPVTIGFGGQPMKMSSVLRFTMQGADTVGSLLGELKVSIPLVGGRIEKVALPLILRAVEVESDLGRRWLAGDRG